MMIYAIVATLAMVQSVFGIGLLLFGTPILLMMGLSFRDALWVLLPASLTVSTLQLLLDRRLDLATAGTLLVWTVPSVGIGLFLVLTFAFKLRIDYLVSAILVVSVLLRQSVSTRARLLHVCHRYGRSMLLVIGAVHGLTNMGGSLLSAYAAAHADNKFAIRQVVVLGYILFASTQLLVLATTQSPGTYPNPLPYVLIAGLVFIGLGRRAFLAVSERRYNKLLNLFELVCALMLIGKNIMI